MANHIGPDSYYWTQDVLREDAIERIFAATDRKLRVDIDRQQLERVICSLAQWLIRDSFKRPLSMKHKRSIEKWANRGTARSKIRLERLIEKVRPFGWSAANPAWAADPQKILDWSGIPSAPKRGRPHGVYERKRLEKLIYCYWHAFEGKGIWLDSEDVIRFSNAFFIETKRAVLEYNIPDEEKRGRVCIIRKPAASTIKSQVDMFRRQNKGPRLQFVCCDTDVGPVLSNNS